MVATYGILSINAEIIQEKNTKQVYNTNTLSEILKNNLLISLITPASLTPPIITNKLAVIIVFDSLSSLNYFLRF